MGNLGNLELFDVGQEEEELLEVTGFEVAVVGAGLAGRFGAETLVALDGDRLRRLTFDWLLDRLR